MKRILMANDLSARSDRALRRAATLAREFGAKLDVLTVLEEMFHERATRRNVELATEALQKQLGALPQLKGVLVSHRVVVGLDYEDIIRRSEEIDADLVVLGLHRHKTREMFSGTTAERVVRFGRRPVLIAKDTVTGPYRLVLVPTDLSPHANAAAHTAARLAPNGRIVLLHVLHRVFPAFLDRDAQDELLATDRETAEADLQLTIAEIRAEMGDQVPAFDTKYVDDDTVGGIHAQIAALRPDLVVAGTHGRSAFARAVIGSVTADLLSECPVDIVAVKAS